MALFPLIRPLIFTLDGERAHRLTIAGLKALPAGAAPPDDPVLGIRVSGLDFPNPVGLAAGFDKDGEVFAQMLGLGFGFAEVGTLTPLPQPGNPKPRLFRLAEDRAVINRLGFNNGGLDSALRRLERRRRDGPSTPLRAGPSALLRTGIVGVNVGANKDSSDRIADYVRGVRTMASVADYLTINISSPNTPGLRGLQDRRALDELLSAVAEQRSHHGPPIFLKLAPDLDRDGIDDVADVAIARGVNALIVSNTTISRPELKSRYRGETGGLSGAPLKSLALDKLREFRSAVGSEIPLIAAGGIETGADAFARIRAGASLVQLYSALIYEGPGLARRICAELSGLLQRDGFRNVAEAVATERLS
jgi:dihydroorotate dehydrogenase